VGSGNVLTSHETLKAILEQAALIVREKFQAGDPVTRKPDGSPLSKADILVNEFLRRELTHAFPTACWLSEESGDDFERLERDWLWVVDPLDGTKEFAQGVPEFSISVGLVHRNRVVLGGVLNPVTGEGGVGGKQCALSFWGLEPRECRATNLTAATASVSRSEVEDESVNPYLSLVGRTRPVGSVAYKLLRVAAGLEDLTFSVHPKNEWDICGGVALIKAAGKGYRRFDGEPINFNQASPRILSGGAAGPVHLLSALLGRITASVTVSA
jgi:myo-inositol-1(or 4)-monophosphatase